MWNDSNDLVGFLGVVLFTLVVFWVRKLLLAIYKTSGLVAHLDDTDADGIVLGTNRSLLERLVQDFRREAATGLAKILKERDSSNLEMLFIQAGYPTMTVHRFHGLRLLLAVVAASTVILMRLLTGFPGGGPAGVALFVLLGVLATVVASILPRVIMQRRRRQRQKQALSEIHLWMHSLAVLLKSGKSVQEAIQILSKYPGILYSQGAQIQRDMQVGHSFAESLLTMSARVGLPEFTEIAKQIAKFHQRGMPLHENLRVQANILLEEMQTRVQVNIGHNILLIFVLMVIFALPVFCTVLIAPVAYDIVMRFHP
jgi:pilus assembly protein TadC